MSVEIPFYFDFISPYAWLGLMKAHDFAKVHGIRWLPRPVVYAALLSGSGLVGPAESASKRRYTFMDAARLADGAGLELIGPPGHPFRSLEALRVQFLFQESEKALELAITLAQACWALGKDLTDLVVLKDLVASLGLDSESLEARIKANSVKDGLRQQTEDALTLGVFGVPTYIYEDELFWGQDRLPQLSARLRGRPGPSLSRLSEALSRPYLVDRRKEKP